MEDTPKKKLCWNCDGRVSLQEENCPYCGVYLSPAYADGREDGTNSLAPPYRLVTEEKPSIPAAPYQAQFEENSEEETTPSDERASDAVHLRQMIATLAFLFGGSIFLLFGVLMFLFSSNGIFTLKWNADYWYVYFFASFPLLFFGWRGLSYLNDEQEST